MSTNGPALGVQHVFVLMLENRSFDHMLGYSGITGTDAASGQPTQINGLAGTESNTFNGQPFGVSPSAGFVMPADPGHEFTNVLQQLCGSGAAYPPGGPYPPIVNTGFVASWVTTGGQNRPGEIMKCFTPTSLPVLHALAREFVVCDNWHASMPGPTWPNRLFVHAASSGGLDHSPTSAEIVLWEALNGFSFQNGTIFDAMKAKNVSRRLYAGDDFPFVAALKGIALSDIRPYHLFPQDVAQSSYPFSYTFIEPSYNVLTDYKGSTSQHPLDDVTRGEMLIKATYEAIRNSPRWNNSLLIITWDEHGGFYDHAVPPPAIAPGDTAAARNMYGFTFEQYGPRVPAIIVSPLIPRNVVDHRLYDHASIPATLEAIFGLNALTQRDAVANNLTSLVSLSIPRTDAPATLPVPAQSGLGPLPTLAGPDPVAGLAEQPPASRPLDTINQGNLPGVLHAALRSDLALSPPEQRPQIFAHVSSLKNRAEASRYLELVRQRMRRARLAPTLPVSIPKVPAELVQACAAGECIAFIGSGLSARAGLKTWSGFVYGLLQWMENRQLLYQTSVAAQEAALAVGDVNTVADNLFSVLSVQPDRILEYVVGASLAPPVLPEAHILLRQIPFCGVMTSNFDSLLETTFTNVPVLTPFNAERLTSLLTEQRPFVLKLYGTPEHEETLLISPAHYQEMIAKNPPFAQFMEAVFFSRTILFVGCSLDGISDYLRGFTFRGAFPKTHYALVATQGLAWRSKADGLKRRFNVEVIGYPEENGYKEVDPWLAELRNQIRSVGRPSTRADHAVSRLRAVELEGIGPFEHLSFDLAAVRNERTGVEEWWQVLLGDNGVGKSTILRAIALAMAGQDGRGYAARLMRSGHAVARIVLKTDLNPSGYVAELYQTGAEVQVICKPTRPLEIERRLVLGFPALRLISWDPSPGPQGPKQNRPTTSDIMPLLKGDVDPRLDDIKQWIVNLSSLGARDVGGPKVLQRFFKIIGHLMVGHELRFELVTEDYQVIIAGPDGGVRLEALSLGMTSLLSWVAVLVQRLHEVHPQTEDPTHEHALVLLDEIDAHLHPLWQQRIVAILKEEFPNVQFITSTHSPLVIGGLPNGQLTRLSRHEGGTVVLAQMGEAATRGRADQVLTSDGFLLETTLPYDVQNDMEEYTKLLALPDRDRGPEFVKLQSRIEKWIGPSAHTELARRARQLAVSTLTQKGNEPLHKDAEEILRLLERNENL